MKGPITIDFLEKGARVINASHFQLFRQYLPYLLDERRIITCISNFISGVMLIVEEN